MDGAWKTADGVSSMDEICTSQMEVDDADRLADAQSSGDVDADRIGNGCTHAQRERETEAEQAISDKKNNVLPRAPECSAGWPTQSPTTLPPKAPKTLQMLIAAMSTALTAPWKNPTAPPMSSMSGGSQSHRCRMDLDTRTAWMAAPKNPNAVKTIVHRITPIHTSRGRRGKEGTRGTRNSDDTTCE